MKKYSYMLILLLIITFISSQVIADEQELSSSIMLSQHSIHFNLERPASEKSTGEELEIYITPGDRDWMVRVEFPEGLVHQNGSCFFPTENLYYLENDDVINTGNGQAVIKLRLWADIRENWNRVLAGKYSGEMVVTITEIL